MAGSANVNEALDVAGVIGNNLCVGVKDVHSENLGTGRQHQKVLNLKDKSRVSFSIEKSLWAARLGDAREGVAHDADASPIPEPNNGIGHDRIQKSHGPGRI